MAPRHYPWAAGTLVALSLVAGCTARQGAEQARSGPSAAARADSARYPYTEADVRFMSAMIGHHAQAVAMANLAATHGASGSVGRLAERIVNGQQDEIASMQQWLRDRGRPVPEVDSMNANMTMQGPGHEHLMPGMVTEARMEQLAEARGSEFDRLFLTLMIQHHRGAVSMVERLFGTRGAAQDETVFKFANDVHVDQSTEIARM
ncbi:MAG: DUF305 domain-containing protein, partial [Gemmatimonadales bacterium]|nr:DUF305 domain-containing protein [Gemmatimonadales bacterium]